MPRRDTESASIATSFIISCEANSNRVVRSSNGEVDKNAHPYFVHDRGTPKPDFIVHVPGSGNNYAVIEVKSAMVDGEGIRDGIEKLVQFRGIGYQRAIYLFYGMRADQAVHQHREGTARRKAKGYGPS